MSSSSTVPFRFLDLPFELRMMIYERLPITRQHHQIRIAHKNYAPGILTLITHTVPPLLRTCWPIYTEAIDFVRTRLRDNDNASSAPKIIVDSTTFIYVSSLLNELFTLICSFREFIEAPTSPVAAFGSDYTTNFNIARQRLMTGYREKPWHGPPPTATEFSAISRFVLEAAWYLSQHGVSTEFPQLDPAPEFQLDRLAEDTRTPFTGVCVAIRISDQATFVVKEFEHFAMVMFYKSMFAHTRMCVFWKDDGDRFRSGALENSKAEMAVLMCLPDRYNWLQWVGLLGEEGWGTDWAEDAGLL
ncbi:hypothetical protein K491DRAFT_717812 [Lophiostoma macrostomum CBS 122681]|uniref:Uncharacterized protein n=1 Tax=Lophiostoma macrostomum CBS 122681 TaxID=1314788 RepID=A0A6A6T5C9_9PLEO|nr:hypothetical protein K491DRAFT_717812 [Lophiostoma macrostomum CBS 122681]